MGTEFDAPCPPSKSRQQIAYRMLAQLPSKARAARGVEPWRGLTFSERNEAPGVLRRERATGEPRLTDALLYGRPLNEPPACDFSRAEFTVSYQCTHTLLRKSQLMGGVRNRYESAQINCGKYCHSAILASILNWSRGLAERRVVMSRCMCCPSRCTNGEPSTWRNYRRCFRTSSHRRAPARRPMERCRMPRRAWGGSG